MSFSALNYTGLFPAPVAGPPPDRLKSEPHGDNNMKAKKLLKGNF